MIKYFELGLGNSVEENWEDFDYSICIKAEREPMNFKEVNDFIKNDLQKLKYKTVVSITEFQKMKQNNFLIWILLLMLLYLNKMKGYQLSH